MSKRFHFSVTLTGHVFVDVIGSGLDLGTDGRLVIVDDSGIVFVGAPGQWLAVQRGREAE